VASEPAVASRRRREQLRDFLRTRRARLTPGDVGMAAVGRRRTPGLRREEVAALAGVGVSWYTWLEQGRDINVSPEVLDAIARALRLTEPERAHLYLLAGLNPPRPAGSPVTDVPAELRHLLDAWAPRPAVLQDRYWNLLAVNDSARTVFGYCDSDHNCLVTFFTNLRYRRMQVQWSSVAPGVVAAFRADAARFPGDRGFGRVVAELSAASSEFAELWARHDVGEHVQTVKAVHHPEAGDLLFDTTTLAVADGTDRHVVLYNPRPGTGTAERLERLVRGTPVAARLVAPA
jgi:transcriptional regulator with XRE-family HTH domain